MNKDEALKLALEALDMAQVLLANSYHQPKMLAAYTAVKQALAAQPEQEPMSWHESIQNQKKFLAEMEALLVKTSTPQRTWVGLTDEELHQICNSLDYYGDRGLVQLIEAKLKEKNT